MSEDTSNTSLGQETAEATSNEQETEQVTETVEETPDVSLDDLMGITEEDYAEFSENAQHKGMKPLHEWMKHVPEDVRKHIANIRSSYTQKTQALAAQRAELENARKEMEQQLLEYKQTTLDNPMLEQMKALAANEDELDLYSKEGIQAAIQREAAKMLKQHLEPAQNKMKQEMEIRRREMALQEFKSANPDLTSPEMKLPIAQLLMERPELKLEDAYYIVKSKLATERALQAEQEALRQRTERRSTLSKTSTGKATTPSGTPKFRDAWEAYQYHKSLQDKK